MKYIIFRIDQAAGLAREVPVVFPNNLVHVEVAHSMRACLLRHFEGSVIREVSAGDFILPDCTCSGESSTLKLISRGQQDRHLIMTYDYMHGIIV